MRTPPEPATFVLKRSFWKLNDDAASPLYARLEPIRRARSFRSKADRNLKLGQKTDKRHRDLHVRFAPIFNGGDKIYLDRLLLLHQDSKKYAAEGYNKMLPKK